MTVDNPEAKLSKHPAILEVVALEATIRERKQYAKIGGYSEMLDDKLTKAKRKRENAIANLRSSFHIVGKNETAAMNDTTPPDDKTVA